MPTELTPSGCTAQATLEAEVTLLTGNCVDRQQLGASSSLILEGLQLLDADGDSLARYTDSLWQTSRQATSWLRVEGEISLGFLKGDQHFQYHRTFPTVELIGLTLWGPHRVMLAYYSQFQKCWIDRGGFECDRIVVSGRPLLHDIESLTTD